MPRSDGEFHEGIARHRADRSLLAALRQTQIEHGHVLAGLVQGQIKIETLIRLGLNLPEQN